MGSTERVIRNASGCSSQASDASLLPLQDLPIGTRVVVLEDMEADQDGTKRKQLPKGSTGTVKENNGRGYYIVFDASYKLGEQPIRYEQMHKLEPL